MNSLYIPWDFVLILLFLGTAVPWRGAVRMRRLLAKPELSSADRLTLYGSTIAFQWLIVAIVAYRCAARSISLDELGITVGDPLRTTWVGLTLTGLLCLNQIFGLRRIWNAPTGKRGTLLALTEKIMPRTRSEVIAYVALACTAGVSEEFLYRGFALTAFVHTIVNYGAPGVGSAVLSSAWFALAHLYQGRRGLITTFIVGLIFALAREWTGSLIPAIAAHAGLDLTIGLYASKSLLRQPSHAGAVK